STIPGPKFRILPYRISTTVITARRADFLIGLWNEFLLAFRANDREPLLTFVVAGGGFAGVEAIGSINDFLKEALPYYPNLKPESQTPNKQPRLFHVSP